MWVQMFSNVVHLFCPYLSLLSLGEGLYCSVSFQRDLKRYLNFDKFSQERSASFYFSHRFLCSIDLFMLIFILYLWTGLVAFDQYDSFKEIFGLFSTIWDWFLTNFRSWETCPFCALSVRFLSSYFWLVGSVFILAKLLYVDLVYVFSLFYCKIVRKSIKTFLFIQMSIVLWISVNVCQQKF